MKKTDNHKDNMIIAAFAVGTLLIILMICVYHYARKHAEPVTQGAKYRAATSSREESETDKQQADSTGTDAAGQAAESSAKNNRADTTDGYDYEDDDEDDDYADVPYVGMSEEDIFDTSIGDLKYKAVNSKQYIFGELRPVTTYTFYEDGQIVFVAECLYGEVYRVRDDRGSGRKKRKPKAYYPEVDEYEDTGPDEFYDYYPDDFMDYEDAEEYYYEHGGN